MWDGVVKMCKQLLVLLFLKHESVELDKNVSPFRKTLQVCLGAYSVSHGDEFVLHPSCIALYPVTLYGCFAYETAELKLSTVKLSVDCYIGAN